MWAGVGLECLMNKQLLFCRYSCCELGGEQTCRIELCTNWIIRVARAATVTANVGAGGVPASEDNMVNSYLVNSYLGVLELVRQRTIGFCQRLNFSFKSP